MTTPERPPFWMHLPDAGETARVALFAVVIGVVTAIVFTAWPGLDIAVSRTFLQPDGSFLLNHSLFWRFLRQVFLKGFTAWYVLVTIGCAATWTGTRTLLGLDLRKWLYQAACSIFGPLVFVNLYLKDHWGRWRPREIVELGGRHLHTAPLDWGGTCLSNCSFVSGEVASMVMAFMALAFVTTAWRPIFYALAIVMGLLEAFIRIGEGGHFLSDALLAGVFMALVACLAYWLMFLAPAEPARTKAGQARVAGRKTVSSPDAPEGRQAAGLSPASPPDHGPDYGPDSWLAGRRTALQRYEAFLEAVIRRGLAFLDLIFPRVK